MHPPPCTALDSHAQFPPTTTGLEGPLQQVPPGDVLHNPGKPFEQNSGWRAPPQLCGAETPGTLEPRFLMSQPHRVQFLTPNVLPGLSLLCPNPSLTNSLISVPCAGTYAWGWKLRPEQAGGERGLCPNPASLCLSLPSSLPPPQPSRTEPGEYLGKVTGP